jgi:peptidoglycan-N-acetylglucosamine deacetylase
MNRILSGRRRLCGVMFCLVLGAALQACPPRPDAEDRGVIESLGTSERAVALTFDACETRTPSYFDSTILQYLLGRRIPFTLFVGGKFALRNREALRRLSRLDFVEIENHSFSHIQHMERLSDSEFVREVQSNEDTLFSIIGRRTKFFRFPGGNYNPRALRRVEGMGYRVVHWSFASGDPDRRITAARLESSVIARTRPGSILIFHINGRGYGTGRALPGIVDALGKKGYRFVRVEEYIH